MNGLGGVDWVLTGGGFYFYFGWALVGPRVYVGPDFGFGLKK